MPPSREGVPSMFRVCREVSAEENSYRMNQEVGGNGHACLFAHVMSMIRAGVKNVLPLLCSLWSMGGCESSEENTDCLFLFFFPLLFYFWWHIPLLLFTAPAWKIMRVGAALTYVMVSVRRGGQWSRRGRRREKSDALMLLHCSSSTHSLHAYMLLHRHMHAFCVQYSFHWLT